MKIEQFLFSKNGEPRETFSDSHMQEISKLWGKKWAKESATVSCFWFGGSFQADHGKGKPQNTMPKLRTVVGRTLLSLGLWVLALCTEAKAAEGTPGCNRCWAQQSGYGSHGEVVSLEVVQVKTVSGFELGESPPRLQGVHSQESADW